MKKMALILQGGGALGAFEYGAVTRLVELGWHPQAVTGVSIGAINAAAIAGAFKGDIAASLHRMWESITLPQVPWLPASKQASLSLFGNPNFYLSRTDYFNLPHWTSLCSTAPLHATLQKNCDFDQINDPRHMRIGVTATNLHTGGPTTFSNYLPHDQRIESDNHCARKARLGPEHIMASGSLPPGFPATEIDDDQYWDGGLFNNTPIDALLNMLEPDEIDSLPIFVVDLFPSAGLPTPDNLLAVQTRTLTLQYQNRFWAQFGGPGGLQGFVDMLEELDRELPAKSPLRKQPAFQWLRRLRALDNIRVIQAAEPTLTGGADFSPYGVKHAYEAGRKAVDQYFRAEQRQDATETRAAA
jgi:NTE family protein